MAGSLCPLSRQRAQMDIREQNRELCSQLLEAKQQILDLREKLNISESTAFSLANQLQKYSKFCRFTMFSDKWLCVFSLRK
uniref:Uncharacterized protein n=1 Tax=Prolemur simus TaxID=1328070 RepID=A0A8C8YNX9_PROSS